MKKMIVFMGMLLIVVLFLPGCFEPISHKGENWARQYIGVWQLTCRVCLAIPDKAGWGVDGFLLPSAEDAWFPPKRIVYIDANTKLEISDVVSAVSEAGRKHVVIGHVRVGDKRYRFACPIKSDSSPDSLPWLQAEKQE